MSVERILRDKGTYAPTISPDAKVVDVIASLESDDVGALVVSTDGLTIDGIISERDIVRGLQAFGPDVLSHPVRDLMTANVVTCTADDRIAGVMALMQDRRIRHVPVTDDGKLAGIISIHDVVKLRLDEVQADAKAMHGYITQS